MSEKTYLGDSVYADTNCEMIILTTENGFGASNTIHLVPEVFEALVQYVASLKAESEEHTNE